MHIISPCLLLLPWQTCLEHSRFPVNSYLAKSYHANSYLIPTRTQTISYPIRTRTQVNYIELLLLCNVSYKQEHSTCLPFDYDSSRCISVWPLMFFSQYFVTKIERIRTSTSASSPLRIGERIVSELLSEFQPVATDEIRAFFTRLGRADDALSVDDVRLTSSTLSASSARPWRLVCALVLSRLEWSPSIDSGTVRDVRYFK